LSCDNYGSCSQLQSALNRKGQPYRGSAILIAFDVIGMLLEYKSAAETFGPISP